MKRIAVHNMAHPGQPPVILDYCSSFFSQLRGLMFRRSVPDWKGLVLVQKSDSRVNSSIHMLFMFTDIAAVWVNNDCKVVDVKLARKWRPAYISKMPARYVLEMNTARLQDFQIGDQVRFEEVWLD